MLTISYLGLLLGIFPQFSTELLPLLSDKKWFSFDIMRKNKWGFDETLYIEVFHFADEIVSLVYSTNSICGLGIKCITLLPHQTYTSSCFVIVLWQGIMQCLRCFYMSIQKYCSVSFH